MTIEGVPKRPFFDGARSVEMPSIEVIYEVQEHLIIIHDAQFYEVPFGQAGRA